jgi:hypothetical protein
MNIINNAPLILIEGDNRLEIASYLDKGKRTVIISCFDQFSEESGYYEPTVEEIDLIIQKLQEAKEYLNY